ncbi:GAS2-like protein 2 [Perognathus longimembris pacificus]|uniref:GAS2-like protein 2 n=1 Tax=Perognathus longimembris pacificus TaxID=214514 RepID=UPI00201924AE|nr:GAS2-like protein 2 [Perognathus longimembris pacificus]
MSQRRGLRRRPSPLGAPVRSIRPFKSSEQYLEAMKEDLAEWLQELYGLNIDAANFLQVLETGLVLCRHANTVTEAALAFLAEAPARAQRIPMPRTGVSCNGAARPGSFQARDNVSNFIQWCRKEMGIQEVLMFETEDLVLRKNVKNVVLCLLELGRRAWRFGVAAPTLVQLEEEIEEELRQDLALPPPDPPPPAPPRRRPSHFRNLDQMVQSLVSCCTCPVQFSMVKVSEGKYRVGDSNTLIFIRILRDHVMVRVGGGWDTLAHYLDKHDPCRCTSLSHKPGRFQKPQTVPVQHEVRVEDGPSKPQPVMTVSRSQSPLPPVDWKTYTSSARRFRLSPNSSPRPRGGQTAAGLREMAPSLRSQERPLRPSQRQPSGGGSLPIPQSSPTHRGPNPRGALEGKKEEKYPGQFPKGRIHEATDGLGIHARAPTPQRLQAPEATTKVTSQTGPSPLHGSSNPAKPPGPGLPVRGASPQLREPASARSPSPVKGFSKIPVQLSPDSPVTPGRSCPGIANGGLMAEVGRSPSSSKTVTGALAGSRHGNCSVEVRQGDQQPDVQVAAEAVEPWGMGPQERERRHASLSLGRAGKQASYHCLEEELVANMELLEVRGACPQDTDLPVIPRSGVYVPSLSGQWPAPGGPYDKVIQELAHSPPTLLKVDLESWKITPSGSHKPAVAVRQRSTKGKLGGREREPKKRASLSRKDTMMSNVSPPGGQGCPTLTVSASQEAPGPSLSESHSDKAKACLGKVKRTLRKPQRVPSIYKLKLRPRMQPRKDHRPEKQPSRIPKPLAYLYLGPARAPPRSTLLRTRLGIKDRRALQADRGYASEKKEEEKKKKERACPVESSPQPLEGQGPRQLAQASPPPEEESWV